MKLRSIWLLLTVSMGVFSCERAKEPTETMALTPKTTDTIVATGKVGETGSISLANLVIYPQQGEPVTLRIEIAQSDDARRHGLQSRETIPEDYGMWFVFDGDVQEPFWMKDTPVALDLLFVDKNYKVVDFVIHTEPNSEVLIVARQKFRYALEVKAGSLERWNLALGDHVELRLGPP